MTDDSLLFSATPLYTEAVACHFTAIPYLPMCLKEKSLVFLFLDILSKCWSFLTRVYYCVGVCYFLLLSAVLITFKPMTVHSLLRGPNWGDVYVFSCPYFSSTDVRYLDSHKGTAPLFYRFSTKFVLGILLLVTNKIGRMELINTRNVDLNVRNVLVYCTDLLFKKIW